MKHAVGRRRPFSIETKLAGAKQRYERGDKGALLFAIDMCISAAIPLPHWVALAFQVAYEDVKHRYLHATWDEVFGAPHPKNLKLHAKRDQLQKQWQVWVRVTYLREKTPRRDVFPAVAAEFGISKGLTRKFFYDADQLLHSSAPEQSAEARVAVQMAYIILAARGVHSLPAGRPSDCLRTLPNR